VPVANKPVPFYGIEALAEAGIRDIGIVVGDTRDEIKAAVGDGSRWNVRVTYIPQDAPRGLAHAVLIAEPFIGNGVEPEREAEMGFSLNLKEGEPLWEDGGEDQALLGTGLAASLKAKVGDVLTVMGTTSDGALNAVDVRVVGLYSTGIKEFDERALKVPLRTAQHLLNSDRVTKIIVKLDATRRTESVAAALVAGGLGPQGAGLGVKTWGDLAGFYAQIGLQFPSEMIVWDTYNPHPRLDHLPREILFVGRDRFNTTEKLSSGLQGREDSSQELLIRFRALAVQDVGEERKVKPAWQGSSAKVSRDQPNAVCKPRSRNQLRGKGQRPGQVKNGRMQLRLNLTKSDGIRTSAAAEVEHVSMPSQVKTCGEGWSQAQRIGV